MRGLVSLIARPIAPLLAGLAFLAVPAPALAQGPDRPLGSCKASFLSFTGPAGGDSKAGSISGHVQLFCDGTWVFAELITWDEKTATASGDLLVMQDGLRVNAETMEMDRVTKLGTFYHASGTARLAEKESEQAMFGSMEPQVMFQGAKLEKMGPKTYRLTDGTFSTCMQPNPRWQMASSSGTVILDDHLSMRNVAIKMKGVPVFFLPYMYVPLEKESRSTGFLIPSYSASSVRGQGISNAFFLTLGRSQDATFFYDYYSKAGQGAGAEYRYVASTRSKGNASYYLLDEKERLAPDGSVERPAHRNYNVTGEIIQWFPRGFRLRGQSYYTNDSTAQQLYQQNVFQQSRRDRNLSLALTGSVLPHGSLSMTILSQMKDYINGSTVARKSVLPYVDLALAGRGLKKSGPFERVYFSAAGTVVYNDVRPDLARPELDRSLWRFDGTTNVTAPLSNLPYLRITARGFWRITNWQESLDPVTAQPVPVSITRNLFNAHADVTGPTLQRKFLTPNSSYSSQFTHVIEPSFSVDYLSPFDESSRVIKIDPGVDSLVGRTATLNYSLTNHLKVKVRGPNNTTHERELLRVYIGQSWYSNPQAGAIDPNYPTATVNTFSSVQFSAATDLAEDVTGVFRMYIDSVAKAVQSYSVTTLLRPLGGKHIEINAGWSKRQYLPGVPGYDNPNIASHFLNATTTLHFRQGRFGGLYDFHYDLKNTGFLQQRFQGFYNSQCCGLAIDYQMMNVSQFALSGVPRDRRLAVTFSLAGLGSFATPLGGFGR